MTTLSSSLVASKAIGVTQILGTHPCFLSHHQPHNVKPKSQRFTAAFRDSPSSCRTLPTAPLAMPQSPLCTPSLSSPASRTNKTIRPPDPFKVVYAVYLCRKPFQCLFKCSRIWVFCRRFHGHHTTHCCNLSQSATPLRKSLYLQPSSPAQAG